MIFQASPNRWRNPEAIILYKCQQNPRTNIQTIQLNSCACRNPKKERQKGQSCLFIESLVRTDTSGMQRKHVLSALARRALGPRANIIRGTSPHTEYSESN